jgi:8-amino-7-oxononanoate synthase
MQLEKQNNSPAFPMKMSWDVSEGKRKGIYTWFREIEQEYTESWILTNTEKMLMLESYSYLGLNKHPKISKAAIKAIERYGTGMHGSRFLAGTTSLHKKLEKKLADLHQKEESIIHSSGYLTNVSTIACLLGKNDVILSDKLNHASIQDGAVYSRATLMRYKHNNIDHLEYLLKKVPSHSRKLVITDTVFSMSGEVADLPNIIKLCKKYNALLMVDECHSMFVLGDTGGGIVEYFDLDPKDIDIYMSTLSKAIPASGGYIAANQEIIEYLRHESRGFMYSGATSTVSMAAALKAIEVFEDEGEKLVHKLHQNTKVFSEALTNLGIDIGNSKTSIIPILVGDSFLAGEAAKLCQDEGIYIHAVFPPVVPAGKAILRASVTAAHSPADLLHASIKIYKVLHHLGVV